MSILQLYMSIPQIYISILQLYMSILQLYISILQLYMSILQLNNKMLQVMILENHGLVSVGTTIEETFLWMAQLTKACEIQWRVLR